MDKSSRLTKEGLTIRQVLQASYKYYGTQVDNKSARMKEDVVSARITSRRNMRKIKGNWTQIGRNVKIVCLVKSSPTSYKRTDGLKYHYYPVTFLINNLSEGVDSTFKYRTGSEFKPSLDRKKITEEKTDKAKKRAREHNIKLEKENIKKGIQLAFFFENMQVHQMRGLLYGRNTTNRTLPKNRNPKNLVYFDKTALLVVTKVIIPILNKLG